MSVHYKFKSALEYDTVTFDGLHISVKDLKKAIIHQKRIGKNTDFDLQVTNAQTKEVYSDENALIPKNTSLVIARIPVIAQAKGKPWEGYGNQGGPAGAPGTVRPEDGVLSKAVDLTQLDASEDDKIRAMMTQSTLDYDPSNYMKIRGSNQVGVVPSHYRCYKCHQPGHWIKDCPLGHGQEPMEIKKSTGIPRSFMVPVEGPMVPGAMMTPTGQYAVPVLDHQAYNEGPKSTPAPPQEEKPEIPEDLVCSICKDLLTDAVMIPCCGNSFCDECIRTTLLESEDHECPDCHEKEISPGTLIPNRFLRNSVSNFKNETGYHKRITYRNAVQAQTKTGPEEGHDVKATSQDSVVHPAESTTAETIAATAKEEVKPDSQMSEEPARLDSQKPVISEADSTETAKVSGAAVKEEAQEKPARTEGPPGVESPELKSSTSPHHPPHHGEEDAAYVQPKPGQTITSVGSQVNHHRVAHHTSSSHSSSSSRSQSTGQEPAPNRHLPAQPLPYPDNRSLEERPGTPTVDEPGVGPPGYGGEPGSYPEGAPPGMHPATTTLPPSQHMHPPLLAPPNSAPPGQQPPYTGLPPGLPNQQPPPGVYPATTIPPAQGYRMPPPGHPDFNRYGPPPRQIFDPTRPPVAYDPHRPPVAPPPGYPPYTGGPRPRGAGYPPSRHMQPPPPGLNHRPPSHTLPGIIDDPLEAFNRMLREKDERDRRARQARRVSRSRSYSRSRSRSRSSRSFSRSPRRRSRTPSVPRGRHRSRTRSPPPRRRPTRSRSRSFSISRSRSFSRSPSFRGSPPREYSPRRRPPSRYRSPLPRASPPRYNRYKENRPPMADRDRERDRLDRDRMDRDRLDRGDRSCDRMIPDRCERDYPPYFDGGPPPDFEYGDGYERGRQRPSHRPPRFGPPPSRKDYSAPDQFYQPPDMCPPASYPPHNNRYNAQRGPPNYPPPLMSVKTVPPLLPDRPDPLPQRRYDDVGPPGLEQPPPPGFENPRYDMRFSSYDRTRDDGPPGVDRYSRTSPFIDRDDIERPNDRARDMDRPRDIERNRDMDRPRDLDRQRDIERPRDGRGDLSREQRQRDNIERDRDRRYSPSPEHRHRSVSPRRHSSRDRYSSTEKPRRKHESSDRDKDKRDAVRGESDRDKKDKKKEKDLSEDDRSKKSKDKKKKKAEKKEAERKKKKEKKEKKEQEKLKKQEEKKAKEATIETVKNEENKGLEEERKEIKEEEGEIKQIIEHDIKTEEKPVELETKPKVDLYDDILTDGIDNNVVAQYGKLEQKSIEETEKLILVKKEDFKEDGHKTEDEEEKDASFDGIELQVSEAELKSDFNEPKSKTTEVLAPVPELSKWEREEEVASSEKSSTSESKSETKQIFDRPNKVVTSEVLKRAENAIFAKAINAIRPIEIKKISLDRAKLYSGEKPQSEISIPKEPVKNIQITIPGPGWNIDMDIAPPGTEPVKLKSDRKTSPLPNRLSVKERLGCKVEELDKITKEERPFERNRSRTLSPLSRRQDEASRNIALGERRVELEDGRRRDDHRRNEDRRHDRNRHERDRRHRSRSREHKSSYRDRHDERRREDDRRKDDRRDDKKDDRRGDRRDDRRAERSRSRTHRSERRSHDRRDDHHRDDRHRDRARDDRDRRDRDRKVIRKSRSRSRSDSRDHKNRKELHKKTKDKKHRKEKESKERERGKKHREDSCGRPMENVKVESKVIVQERKSESSELKSNEKPIERAKAVEDRRKPTLDEANFEPDYDLDTESEKEDSNRKTELKKRDRSRSTDITNQIENQIKKKIKVEEEKEMHKKSHQTSSSSESSDSSSDAEKHKKKHRKHKKKKSKRDSSSSSSDSDSDSSVEEKKKKRHKNRKQKKRKKSKHK